MVRPKKWRSSLNDYLENMILAGRVEMYVKGIERVVKNFFIFVNEKDPKNINEKDIKKFIISLGGKSGYKQSCFLIIHG